MPGWERAKQTGIPGCTSKAPEHLLSSQPPGTGSSKCNTSDCRSRTASQIHIPQLPFHSSPSALTRRPLPLRANGKSSILSGLPPGPTSLQWQLLECITFFFTVSEGAILDLSYSYLKKAIQVESSRIHHSYHEEWEHHRKTRNVNCNTNDKMTEKMFWQAVVTQHSCFQRSLLFCTNNKRTGTFLSLN